MRFPDYVARSEMSNGVLGYYISSQTHEAGVAQLNRHDKRRMSQMWESSIEALNKQLEAIEDSSNFDPKMLNARIGYAA